MTQRLRGLVSTIVLVLLVAGVPILVVVTGVLDPPAQWPSLDVVVTTILDGRVSHDAAIGAMAVVVVVLWLRFVVGVAIAVASVARGRSTPTVRGLGRATQLCAAGLVSGALLLVASGAALAAEGSPSARTETRGDGRSTSEGVVQRSRHEGRSKEQRREGKGTAASQAVMAPRAAPACPSALPGGAPDLPVGLGAAALVTGGLVVAVERARRRRLRSIVGMASMASATTSDLEAKVRELAPVERLVRLDLAVRLASTRLHHDDGGRRARGIEGAILDPDGTVHLMLSSPSPTQPPFVGEGDTRWRLPSDCRLPDLAEAARETTDVPRALTHLGVAEGGDVFIDVHALRTLSVEGDDALSIVRAMAAGLAVSPFASRLSLITVALDVPMSSAKGVCEVTALADLDAAIDLVAVQSMPTVLMVGADATTRVADLSALPLDGDVALVGVGPIAHANCRLRHTGGWWLLEPWGLVVRPVRLSADDVSDIQRLLGGIDDEMVTVTASSPAATVPSAVVAPPTPAPPFAEMAWTFVVRVLGPVAVEDRGGRVVVAEKSRSVELIAWLALHRERPSRSGARTAMWDLDVQDATFANVVSEARRALARAVPSQEEWLGRTLGDTLPLHPSIVSDADLLEARLVHARSQSLPDAVQTLRAGLAWVRGMPCADSGYRWPDADGTTSRLVILVTAAAVDMATRCLVVDDLEGLFWATGRGLMALPGHEELVGLRMRGHARRGDLAGVRHEWGTYVRSLRADSFADDDPSPKLVALREGLLSGDPADHALGVV